MKTLPGFGTQLGFLGLLSSAASAQVRVIPEVRWQPAHDTPPANTKVALVDAANLPVTSVNGQFVVQWDPVTKRTLVLALVASLSELAPQPYAAQSLELQFPYYLTQKTINLVMAPSVPDGSAKAATRLYSKVVTTMSLESLMAFYQDARGAATARMSLMNGDWQELDDYTVQVVYKYLQATLWLGKKEPRVVVRDSKMIEAREWLADALQNKRARVQHALGSSANAEQLLGELQQSDGTLLGRVWAAILNEPDDGRRCQLLEFFKQDAAQVEVPGIQRAHQLSAQAQCYVALYKRTMPRDTVVVRKLGQLTQEMQATLRGGNVPAQLAQYLRSDIGTIGALLGQ